MRGSKVSMKASRDYASIAKITFTCIVVFITCANLFIFFSYSSECLRINYGELCYTNHSYYKNIDLNADIFIIDTAPVLTCANNNYYNFREIGYTSKEKKYTLFLTKEQLSKCKRW